MLTSTPRRRPSSLAGLLLALAMSVPAGAAAQGPQAGPAAATDEDPGGLQRMYYELKPAVVYIWSTIEAEVSVSGPLSSVQGEGVLEDLEYIVDAPQALQAVIGFSGSGWLVTPDGYVVTNGHVIQAFHEENEEKLQWELFDLALEAIGFWEYKEESIRRTQMQRDPANAPFIGGLTEDQKFRYMQRMLPYSEIVITKNLDVYTQNWRRYPAEVKEYSPPIFPFEGRLSVPGLTMATGKDVAVLKIEGRDLPTVTIGDSEQMRIGEPVHLAGYPMVTRGTIVGQLSPETEIEASFTRGQVSSVKMDVKGSNVIQYDAATSPGHSGGPLFNDRGEVVGMATLGTDAGFYFAVPTSVILEFVRSAGVTPNRGMFDRNWDRTLDEYYPGIEAARAGRASEAREHLTTAVAGFDQALRILPDLRDAVELRREAMAALDTPQPGPPGDGGGILPWAIGGVIVLGLGFLGAGFAMRRRGEEVAEAEALPIEPEREPGVLAAGDGGNGLGRLVVRAGPLLGNRFPLPDSGLKIGRDPSTCQIVLSEGTVSREHAVVLPSGHEIQIRNLSGTNPTYVNDRAIQETTLRAGDQIRIGSSVLDFESA